jgi:NADPH2:quinone reductase
VAIPPSVDFATAAGFQIAYGTSHLALAHRAGLQPGETLLVLGAAGGVGLTAVEIGKAMGARVVAAARGAERLAIARAAGADHVIDTETEDLREAMLALGRADVVYDPVGGDQHAAAFRALRPEGRILLIGFASGDLPVVKPNHMLVKNTELIGFHFGAYLEFAPEMVAQSFEALFAWHQAGEIEVRISNRFALEEAGAALELLRSRAATGKIIVTP